MYTCAVTLDVLDSIEQINAFQPEWQRFLRRCPPPTPFQTPEWLLTWWSHFGSGQPHVLVVEEAAEPVAVVPCFLHEWNGRKQMTLMGSGISDYLDPILDHRYEREIVECLSHHLTSSSDWEICDW